MHAAASAFQGSKFGSGRASGSRTAFFAGIPGVAIWIGLGWVHGAWSCVVVYPEACGPGVAGGNLGRWEA